MTAPGVPGDALAGVIAAPVGGPWLSGDRVPGTPDVLAVGHRLDAICDCSAAEPGHEATDPDDRSVRIPHHFDCAAVMAWPAVADYIRAHLAPLIAERERAAAVEALREAADEIDATVGTEPVLMHVVDWVDGVEYAARRVRDRADRRAER